MKNNKLIAEFMGWEYDEDNDWYFTPHRVEVGEDIYDNEVPAELFEFNTSWDWLMPVVEKCLEKHNNLIDGRDVVDTSYSSIAQPLQVVSRKETHKAVVEFIKEYNKTQCNNCGDMMLMLDEECPDCGRTN